MFQFAFGFFFFGMVLCEEAVPMKKLLSIICNHLLIGYHGFWSVKHCQENSCELKPDSGDCPWIFCLEICTMNLRIT